jgi:hypothetical protein
MIRQYLSNNNKTAAVAFRQKFCQLNSPGGKARRGTQHRLIQCTTPTPTSSSVQKKKLQGDQQMTKIPYMMLSDTAVLP